MVGCCVIVTLSQLWLQVCSHSSNILHAVHVQKGTRTLTHSLLSHNFYHQLFSLIFLCTAACNCSSSANCSVFNFSSSLLRCSIHLLMNEKSFNIIFSFKSEVNFDSASTARTYKTKLFNRPLHLIHALTIFEALTLTSFSTCDM